MPHVNAITLDALGRFPRLLAEHYAAIPHEFKHWVPASWDGVPSEPLTAIEQLCHVRDIEIEGYQVRFRRTLTENNPLLESIDTNALVRERQYASSNADSVLAEFAIARAQTIAVLNGLTTEQLARAAMFEGYGPVTLQSLVHFLCSHDQQHLSGLQWLLGKLEATQCPFIRD
jgi:DinB superfamily